MTENDIETYRCFWVFTADAAAPCQVTERGRAGLEREVLYQREDGLTSCPHLLTYTRKSHTFLQKTSARRRMTRLKHVWCLSTDLCFSLRINRTINRTALQWAKGTHSFWFHNATTFKVLHTYVCMVRKKHNKTPKCFITTDIFCTLIYHSDFWVIYKHMYETFQKLQNRWYSTKRGNRRISEYYA